MRRRTFLKTAALLPLAVTSRLAPPSRAPGSCADVVIIGGGIGGCAAALAAARAGRRVILTEETDWIGGQLTAQAVPPDEHPWIESFGATRLYRRFRDGVRDYYRRHYPLTAEARAADPPQPRQRRASRGCATSRASPWPCCTTCSPRTSAAAASILLTEHRAVRADVKGDRVAAVTVRDLRGGRERGADRRRTSSTRPSWATCCR